MESREMLPKTPALPGRRVARASWPRLHLMGSRIGIWLTSRALTARQRTEWLLRSRRIKDIHRESSWLEHQGVWQFR